MTPEELAAFLNGRRIEQVLDLKSLLLDRLRDLSPDEIHALFELWLPQLTRAELEDYVYMHRDDG